MSDWAPWTAAQQASLSFTICRNSHKLMSTESVMPSSHLILCHPFSSRPQTSPASGYFPMRQLYTSGGQSIGASASVLPMNIQCWFFLGLNGLISLLSNGLSSLLQHHNSEPSVFQCPAFFMVQLSHPCMTTGKTIALTIWTLVGKLMSLLFNAQSRFVKAFLPRSKHLLISCMQ